MQARKLAGSVRKMKFANPFSAATGMAFRFMATSLRRVTCHLLTSCVAAGRVRICPSPGNEQVYPANGQGFSLNL
jgi:hypothetical protein